VEEAGRKAVGRQQQTTTIITTTLQPISSFDKWQNFCQPTACTKVLCLFTFGQKPWLKQCKIDCCQEKK